METLKKPKQVILQTWLPVFNGFYNTHYDDCLDDEVSEINTRRVEDGLEELDNIEEWAEIDYNGFTNAFAQEACDTIKNGIENSLGIEVLIFFEKVVSPKFYNYRNDSINICIHFTQESFDKFVDLIYEHQDLVSAHLKSVYTGQPGFIPSHSNEFHDWELETNCFRDFSKDNHKLGALLEALLLHHFNEEIFSDITGSMDLEEFIENYDDLRYKILCESCGEEFVDVDFRSYYDITCERFIESWKKMTDKPLPEIMPLKDWINKLELEERVCDFCRADNDDDLR